MTNVLSTLATARAATPLQNLVKGNQFGGRIRALFSTATNPAAGGVGIGEYISWGFLPLGARVLFGVLTVSAGAAASTLNLGDPASAARYLAASAVNAATNIAINPPATFSNGAAGFEVATVAIGQATDQSELRSTCAGAALGANQTLTLFLAYVTSD
jgi:hypothetical protein